MKKIYLVDVSSIFFRSFYAIRQLSNSKGMPTNALYGFLAAVTKLLKEHKPDSIAFCFDRPEDGFREEIYPQYKANRSEAPDDLIKQFPYLPIVAEALNVATFDKAGFEADDLIGTLAVLAKNRGQEVTIVSGDKDFAQLVQPGVRIFDPAKDLFIGDDEVKAKFGVMPSQIIDYLALVGDSSDNVPGVKGVGPKAAQKLLGEFGTLENVYEHLNDIKNDRLRELMTTQKEQALMSKKLVTIVTDVPVEYSDEIIRRKPPRPELLTPLLQELEFKSLLTRLLGDGAAEGATMITPAPESGDEKKEVIVVKESSVQDILFERIDDINLIEEVFLKEWESLAQQSPKPSFWPSLWIDSSPTGLAFAMGKKGFHFEGNIEKINTWLSDFLVKTRTPLSGFDIKSIAHQMKIPGRNFFAVHADPMLAAYCLGHEGDFELKDLIKIHLEKDLPELAGPAERLQLCQELDEKLVSEAAKTGVQKVLKEIELPLVPVLYRMEDLGVLIDSDSLREYSAELKQQIKDIEKEIFKSAGHEFNVGSPKQLAQVLFDKLKLPVIRKTKTGYSTDSDVLEKLKSQHQIADQILDWRELSKLNSTYVEALPQLVSPLTGRVHTRYNQAVTSTGRLSSVHPNLQNIPIRTPRGLRIRTSFVAPHGSVILSADYSQVELRILAHITKDKALCEAFEKDLDIHSATASEIFGVALGDVTSDQRRTAKAINFGIVYGMSEFGLAENLGIDRREAAEFIKRYFDKYPGVKNYMGDVVRVGAEKGYVETMFGRRRYYPGLKSSNRNVRQMAERAAINMPIQGAAADMIKLAMIKIDQELKDAKMIMQVHDELVFEVAENKTEELKSKVRNWMGETTRLRVPLRVDVESGRHW